MAASSSAISSQHSSVSSRQAWQACADAGPSGLALINCALAGSGSIMQLAAFTGITSLKLQVQDADYTDPSKAQLELSVKLLCILPQLQQLQHLSLAGIPLPCNWQATALSSSSRLVSLDITDVSAKHPTTAGSAAAASTAGSQLNLQSSLQRLSCSKSVIPGSIFAGASHLTNLEVSMLVSDRVDQIPRLSPIGTATALVALQLYDLCEMAGMQISTLHSSQHSQPQRGSQGWWLRRAARIAALWRCHAGQSSTCSLQGGSTASLSACSCSMPAVQW